MRILALILLLLICGTASAQFIFTLPPPSPAKVEPEKSECPTLYGDVDEHSAAAVIDAIHAANKTGSTKPLKFYLQSPGGSVMAGNAVISAMAASRRPIVTVIVGECASMCAVIAEHGYARVILPHGLLMFHNASMGLNGEVPHIAGQLGVVLRMWAGNEEYVAKRIGMGLAEFRAHESMQWWLTATEAAQAHMVDAIVNPTDYPVPRG